MINGPRCLRVLPKLLAICLVTIFSAVSAAADNEDSVWTVLTATDSFSADDGATRWHYWFDAQARYFDLGSGINQYLVRPGIGYEISDNLSAWVGYARLRSRNRAGNVSDENRYWQQLSWTAARWNDGTLSIRTRVEQRSLSTGDDVGIVLRVLAKYVRPVGNDGKRYVSLGLEPFIDLRDTDWGGDSGIAQNRASIGVGWRVSTQLTVEAGYINQFVWVDSGADRMNHVGVLNLKIKF